MTLAALAFAALMTFPQPRGPESVEQYQARMAVVAAGIEAGVQATPQWLGSPEELAIMLVTIGYFESRFVLRVHVGKCRREPGECGWNGRRHTSVTPWQVEVSPLVPLVEWRTLTGVDVEATTRAATAAARVLAHARYRCGRNRGQWWPEPTIAMYATGKSCKWSGAIQRAWLFRRLLAQHDGGDDASGTATAP